MNNKLLKYALSQLGFEQDVMGSSQYYLTQCPGDLFIWYDGSYEKFFMRDFLKNDTMDTLLQINSIEELQEFLKNLK
jgi:hypothetical protein